jgi:hypothetical protein
MIESGRSCAMDTNSYRLDRARADAARRRLLRGDEAAPELA